MEPIYINFSEILLDNQKKFVLQFTKNDKIKKVLFCTNKEYFITSMKCFIKFYVDLTDWKEYRKIKKLSETCRTTLNKGTGVGFNLNKSDHKTDTLG